jgi:hypothetical protein
LKKIFPFHIFFIEAGCPLYDLAGFGLGGEGKTFY